MARHMSDLRRREVDLRHALIVLTHEIDIWRATGRARYGELLKAYADAHATLNRTEREGSEAKR